MSDLERVVGIILGRLDGYEKRLDQNSEDHAKIMEKLDTFGVWKAGISGIIGFLGILLGYYFGG